jgi:hypothetical protein
MERARWWAYVTGTRRKVYGYQNTLGGKWQFNWKRVL